MIAYLRGLVASLGEDHLVVDVQGVGYLVYAGARTLHHLPSTGQQVELLIETQLREESLTLYGFLDPSEKAWFRLLQTVQGVGARVALSLLGALGPDALVTAIASQDKAALSRASGVGPRLAARLLSELKDRVAELPRGSMAAPIAAAPPPGSPAEDALQALLGLGFGRSEAVTALARIQGRLGETAPIEQLVREGLKELAR